MKGQFAQRMQCDLIPLQQYGFGKCNQQNYEETLGQIDEESEYQIPNNDADEEAHVNNNEE